MLAHAGATNTIVRRSHSLVDFHQRRRHPNPPPDPDRQRPDGATHPAPKRRGHGRLLRPNWNVGRLEVGIRRRFSFPVGPWRRRRHGGYQRVNGVHRWRAVRPVTRRRRDGLAPVAEEPPAIPTATPATRCCKPPSPSHGQLIAVLLVGLGPRGIETSSPAPDPNMPSRPRPSPRRPGHRHNRAEQIAIDFGDRVRAQRSSLFAPLPAVVASPGQLA